MKYHEEISALYQRISPYVKHTPLISSSYYSQSLENTILYKCENLQYTNSFKVRGVFSKVAHLADKKKILIASSGGNHGLAVAFAAKRFAMQAIIIVPSFVPEFRINKIKELGAEVIVHGNTIDEALAKINEYLIDPKYIHVHPFDDDAVIAGQATVALEILQVEPDIDAIVVSIGGGGLISGIAQYAKSFNPNIAIYGVQTLGADAMFKSLEAGKLITIPAITSIAISLGATKVTTKTFDIVKNYVDQVVTVSDAEAMHELKTILDKDKLFVEPASSCVLAALTMKKLPLLKRKKVAAILCGGNFSLTQLREYL